MKGLKLWVLEVTPNPATVPDRVYIYARNRRDAKHFYRDNARSYIHIVGIRKATERETMAWPMVIR